jgi:hypothetical protein
MGTGSLRAETSSEPAIQQGLRADHGSTPVGEPTLPNGDYVERTLQNTLTQVKENSTPVFRYVQDKNIVYEARGDTYVAIGRIDPQSGTVKTNSGENFAPSGLSADTKFTGFVPSGANQAAINRLKSAEGAQIPSTARQAIENTVEAVKESPASIQSSSIPQQAPSTPQEGTPMPLMATSVINAVSNFGTNKSAADTRALGSASRDTGDYVTNARNSLDYETNKLSDPKHTPLVSESSGEARTQALEALGKLRAIDRSGGSLESQVSALSDLVYNNEIQANARKILGPEKTNLFNQSVWAAEQSLKDQSPADTAATAAAYQMATGKKVAGLASNPSTTTSALSKLTAGVGDNAVTGTRLSPEVLEWLAEANRIASQSNLDKISDPTLRSEISKGNLALQKLIKSLRTFKGLDLMNLVGWPLPDLGPLFAAAQQTALVATRETSRLPDPKAKLGANPRLEELKNFARKKHSKLASTKDVRLFADEVLVVFDDDKLRASWRQYALGHYQSLRRSAAIFIFEQAISQDPNLQQLLKATFAAIGARAERNKPKLVRKTPITVEAPPPKPIPMEMEPD